MTFFYREQERKEKEISEKYRGKRRERGRTRCADEGEKSGGEKLLVLQSSPCSLTLRKFCEPEGFFVKGELSARERVRLKGMKVFAQPIALVRYEHICLKFSSAHRLDLSLFLALVLFFSSSPLRFLSTSTFARESIPPRVLRFHHIPSFAFIALAFAFYVYNFLFSLSSLFLLFEYVESFD